MTEQFGYDPAQPGVPSQAPQYPAPPQPYQQAPYGAMPPPYGYPGVVVQQAPSNGLGTAGFVTGLLGLILFWVPVFGLILGLLGIILGGVGISNGHKKGAGTGLAIAGLLTVESDLVANPRRARRIRNKIHSAIGARAPCWGR